MHQYKSAVQPLSVTDTFRKYFRSWKHAVNGTMIGKRQSNSKRNKTALDFVMVKKTGFIFGLQGFQLLVSCK